MRGIAQKEGEDGDLGAQDAQSMHLDRRLALGKSKFTANHMVRVNSVFIGKMLSNVVRPVKFDALRQINSDASIRQTLGGNSGNR